MQFPLRSNTNQQNKVALIFKGTLLSMVTGIFFSIVRMLLPLDLPSNVSNTNSSIETNILLVLFPLLLSPIVEEILFRKWLPNFFQDILGRRNSILLSNTLFTLLHLDLFFFPYFFNGLIYARYYEKSKDVVVPISIHILYNLFVILLTFI